MRPAPLRQPLPRALALCALALGGTDAVAAGAHVHGQGALDVAVENSAVDLFLRAPLGDVTGEEGRDIAALETRYGGADIFDFVGARCTLATMSAEVAALSDSDAADEFSDVGDHDQEADHEHDDHEAHEEHADHHDEHEGDHEGHDAEDHSGHSDALLSWRYDCDGSPTRLDAAALFERVALEKILVQSIGPAGVVSATLTPEETTLPLR
ncbi:MAG: DUF2796 domain-containing protein [Pseudomonadales bacterium]|jgi:hypothetical protein|nr:DUF2796 domain-containing protein [Pseudomonadales bacterium]